MNVSTVRKTLLVGAAITLTACGGGGGGGGPSFTPTPPSTPPAPTPTAVVVFPGVTTSTSFATLGYESPGRPIQTGSLAGSGFSVSYDAQANAYVMDVPSSDPGVFRASGTGERYWNGTLTDPSSGGSQPIFLNVFRPGAQNWDFPNLTYTSFAEYSTNSGEFGLMAFGSPTPGPGVPVTGSATYNAFAAGATDAGYGVRGDVTLQFNFGAGTLSGSFDPYIYDLLSGHTPLGHYDFVNTVFGVGSTTFSGELSKSGIGQKGAFNGLFTGPMAQELMARWTAPLVDPTTGASSQMFGVWVGKR